MDYFIKNHLPIFSAVPGVEDWQLKSLSLNQVYCSNNKCSQKYWNYRNLVSSLQTWYDVVAGFPKAVCRIIPNKTNSA